jgi:hypothetical protein
METLGELNSKKEELEGRLRNLEEQKTSLEKDISFLIEQIPVLDMARYASLLESHTRALRGVRDMLQHVADQETRAGERSSGLPTN